jgi:LPXTG-motif cell wall-anchored protein
MKKLIQILGLVACISTVGVAPSFACSGPECPSGNQGGKGGGGAPAPEIGASALGLLLAGGVAFYVIRRRRA